MKRAWWDKLDVIARNMTPFGLTVFLVILAQVPLQIPGFARVAPVLPLIAIYHWAVFRPELMPAYLVFLIGLLNDILAGTLMGLSSIMFLVVYGIIASQRRFFVGKTFAVLWLGFAVVSVVASLVGWALVSIIETTIIDPRATFFQYLLTVGFFPLLAWMFLRWQKAFLKQA
jgi:rod shape-determining protein MreD